MSETPYPLNPETAGMALSAALDIFFRAAALGVYEGENGALLNDLGLAVSFGIADGSKAVQCVRVANWTTKDLFTFERSIVGEDISDGLEHDVQARISHNDMMGNSIRVPFQVNDEYCWVDTMKYAVTTEGIIVPYFMANQGDAELLLAPLLDDCKDNTPEMLGDLLSSTELSLLTSMYDDSVDIMSTILDLDSRD